MKIINYKMLAKLKKIVITEYQDYDEAAEGFIKKIKELSGYDVHLEIY